jgi:NAD(P)-dependent dehydrogenase (short-subunit alcohol dehydrogenase family)
MRNKQVWLVTGASRGLGHAIVSEALSAGHEVVATTRSGSFDATGLEGADRLMVERLDVADQREVAFQAVVAKALARFGRIDVLVNNAGFGDLTAFEEADDAQIARTFETNVFGLMRVTRAVLPVMRQQGAGRILNITSSAGNDGRGPALYHTAKAAAAAFTESLAFEVGSFGIKPTNVAPGFFRTDFLDPASMKNEAAREISAYDAHRAMIARFRQGANHEQGGDPARLGRLLVTVAAADDPPLHLPVGADAIATLENHHRDIMADVAAWREALVKTKFDPSEINLDPASFFSGASRSSR